MYVNGKTETICFIKSSKEAASYEVIDDQPFLRVRTKYTDTYALLNTAKVSAETWHRRLSHISYQNVEKTAKITTGIKALEIPQDPRCEPCQLGKSVRTISRTP